MRPEDPGWTEGHQQYWEDKAEAKSDCSCACSTLTRRERWLVGQAFIAGNWAGMNGEQPTIDQWLNDMAADAVTVEMTLLKGAPD